MTALTQINCAYCGSWTSNEVYCCSACEVLDGKFEFQTDDINSAFSHLDQANFKTLYKQDSPEFDYLLYVEGLQCASCIHLLEKIPEFESSIQTARVDYAHSQLGVKVNSEFSLSHLAALLTSWGYKPHFLKPSEKSDSIQLKENKKLLKKLAVTGACAGNIMLFVIPVYSGLVGDWKTVFNWMSFFLFLPILLYSGTTFYKGAWNSLRYKVVSVDLPITVALVSGFLLSTYNLLIGNDHIYFDSTAGFIFLILSSRYYLKLTQQKFLDSIRIQDFVKNNHFIRINGDKEEIVALEELKAGDILKLKAGDVLPVDGILLSPALLDIAVLNGEPLPRQFEMKMSVLAGSRLLSASTQISISVDSDKSHLATLIKELQGGNWKKAKFIGLTDRCAQWLVVSVFALAILFFIFYFHVNAQEALNRSLALIVLSCPCALAFGAPLALNSALREAQRRGILIKSATTFEKVNSLKNIFFDKTGTLTDIDLKLVQLEPSYVDSKVKSIIISLEQQSYHPIAFSLRQFWPEVIPLAVENRVERMGMGVSGKLFGKHYELAKCEDKGSEDGMRIVLLENGIEICRLTFESKLLPDCPRLISEIKSQGRRVFLLSGDHSHAVTQVARECEMDPSQVFGGLNAEQKRNTLSQFTNTCMIGDGTNDSLALQSADVGIAVKGSTYASLNAADIYFTRAGLSPLLDLFEIAQKTKVVVLRNIYFSLAYNVIGGALALGGFVNPWLAAVLMPVSSFAIIASTVWGFR